MIRETEAGPYAGRITADCHIHTEFSADSETKITDQVERAIELGAGSYLFYRSYGYGLSGRRV